MAAAAVARTACGWRLSLYGLRRGEVMGLRWSDVDIERCSVSIEQSRTTVDGGKEVIDVPKSVRSVRTLPLDHALVSALRGLRTRQSEERLAAGPAYDGRREPHSVP
jgi:integrase